MIGNAKHGNFRSGSLNNNDIVFDHDCRFFLIIMSCTCLPESEACCSMFNEFIFIDP